MDPPDGAASSNSASHDVSRLVFQAAVVGLGAQMLTGMELPSLMGSYLRSFLNRATLKGQP